MINIEYPKNAVHYDQHLPTRDIHEKVKLHDCIEVQIVSVTSAIILLLTYVKYYI